MSLHHGRLVHGSVPNCGGGRRVGLAIRYIAADVRQTAGTRGTATLVRGRNFGHFDLEEEPEGDFDPAAMERYRSVLRRWMSVVSMVVGNYREPN
jgi:non-haem Fe2+, alpha-ketoglutarate-dependent halogenase